MKTLHAAALALAVFTLSACDDKPRTLGDKIEDKVNDGLDRRPGEKVRDAGEDLKDAAKDVKKEVKDAVRN